MSAKSQLKNLLTHRVGEANLACKWLPREKSSNKEIAIELRKFLKMSPKEYRKTLASLSGTVENKMCANDWSSINYEHVPSVAASRYQQAFNRHDTNGYNEYKKKLINGTAKVNSGAVYPYDIISAMRVDYFGKNKAVQQAQWDSLPNYVGDAAIIPVVDVSGSMTAPAGNNPFITCLDVAISIGLYLSEKNKGAFRDMFLTFSDDSQFQVLSGSLRDRYNQLLTADWGMSTNLESSFDEILRVGTTHNVPASEMPKYIIILSDMEFNQCVDRVDAITMIKQKYADAGYVMPNIIFWNILSRSGHVPVRYDESGTALVSGFSPAIVKSVLSAENLTPASVMLETLNSSKYAIIL